MTATATPPTWDLTDYFDGFRGEAHTAFAARLEADVEATDARLRALPPIADDPTGWAAALVALEDVNMRFGHLGSYLGCLGACDVRDEDVQQDRGALAALGARYQKLIVLVEAAFKQADDAAFDALVAQPDIASAAYILRRIRTKASRSMDAALEELTAELDVTGFSAWGRLYSRLAGGLEFTLERPDGTTEQVPMSLRNSLLADADGAVRKAAFDGSNAAWAGVEHVASAALNAIAGTRLTLYQRRGIDHFLEPALFQSAVSQATLDAMLEAIRAHQELPRQYLRTKARLLGMERLGFCDLGAPLPIPDRDPVDWAAAEGRVRSAFDRVYPALGEYSAMAFDRRWIDAEPRSGRSPGGFCTSSALIRQSRIFMTYNQTLSDVQTLAHELGHAFHNWVMRELRFWSRRYPMTLAETASTFAETALTDAILGDPDATPATRLEVLDTRLDNASAFLLNIPMRFDFEHAFYTERAAGEVSTSRLKALMEEAQRANYGDALAGDQLDPYFWASKLHFYITGVSFYNFPYSFGYLFSLAIYARAREEGASFLEVFEELLRRTGSDDAEGVARGVLGVDLTDPAFWAGPMSEIQADLEAFETLAAEVLPGA